MCFDARNISPQTAEEDIGVYKVIDAFYDASAVMRFLYSPYKEYGPTAFGFGAFSTHINEGWHSYTLDRAKMEVDKANLVYSDLMKTTAIYYWKMVEFIIPKGAIYYHDPVLGTYVSSKIWSGSLENIV